MIIKVTKEDIRLGTPGSTTRCPVARAVRRALKKPVEVGAVNIWRGKSVMLSVLPASARRFIMRFDGAKPVKPFKFCLVGL